MYEWVQNINETAAVAPSYDMVYEEFSRIRADYKLSCDGGAAYGSRKMGEPMDGALEADKSGFGLPHPVAAPWKLSKRCARSL